MLNLSQWPLNYPSLQVPLLQELDYVVQLQHFLQNYATKDIKITSKYEKMVEYQNFEMA